MPSGWKLKLIRPVDAVAIAVNKGWALALRDLEWWMGHNLVPALVHGGFGIQGIQDTDFYRFVSSSRGLSELGIEATEPPKLLQAYKKTFKVARNNRLLMLKFGDVALLKLGTPHPAAGTGNLHVTSWLEFVDGAVVNRGFVPRTRLRTLGAVKAEKFIRLGDPLGGLMLPRGVLSSSGLWRFPIQLQSYENKWFQSNVGNIERAIIKAAIRFLSDRLS